MKRPVYIYIYIYIYIYVCVCVCVCIEKRKYVQCDSRGRVNILEGNGIDNCKKK